MGSVRSLTQFLVICFLAKVAYSQNAIWSLGYTQLDEPIHMHIYQTVHFNISGPTNPPELYLIIYSETPHIAEADKTILLKPENFINGVYSDSFNITAVFLGQTNIVVELQESTNNNATVFRESIGVVVIREVRVIDTIFTASVATLVSIIYINFGCALKWENLRLVLKRPIGASIGFCSQFVLMPTLSYVLGLCLFPDNPEMQLGMFFTGVSPGGGASNIWTLILDGNIDLSITMTTISTFAAFGMMPLWIFTLGREIFSRGNLAVPYSHISTYAISLVVPLAIGILLQKYLNRVAKFLERILKMFGTLLILFIVIFAIVTNLYLFELFSWQIVVAGLGLPWLGYLFGYAAAFIFKQPPKDRLAIAIETGIQNTGISIFLLRFCLPQPQADLTTIAPVSVAIMTPFPLIALYIYKKLSSRCGKKDESEYKLRNSSGNGDVEEFNANTER